MKRKKKRSIVFMLSMLVLICYCGFNLVDTQIKISQKQEQIKNLNSQLQIQQQKNDRLKTLLNSDRNNAYVLQRARDDLGYIFQGERVFIDVPQ